MGAPPIIAPAIDVTLTLFGGMDTELSPSDVPEGLSPDNQDMVYAPGSTGSRPGLHKLFATPFPNNVSVVYAKSYVQPNGTPLTLILTSDGKLWVEDIANSPGTYTQIGSTVPGLYAQSVSAFGREYIAVSDLLHGQGVPLQYDGTNLDRVTMDGPGAGPALANYLPPAATLQGAGAGAPINGSNAVVSDPQTVQPPAGGGGGGVPPQRQL